MSTFLIILQQPYGWSLGLMLIVLALCALALLVDGFFAVLWKLRTRRAEKLHQDFLFIHHLN